MHVANPGAVGEPCPDEIASDPSSAPGGSRDLGERPASPTSVP